MAASSEIRFKIGADTSALSTAFVKAQSIAAVAGKQIERKFGMKDLMRGFMQGIGIGSVEQIVEAVVRPFEAAAERAQTLVELTARLRQIAVGEMVSAGGRDVKIREMQREVRDLNVEIEKQQDLADSLRKNPFTTNSPKQLEAERELTALKVRQAEVQSQLNTEQRTSDRFIDSFNESQHTLNDLMHEELADSGERIQLQIKLNALRKEEEKIKKQGDKDTPRHAANFGQQMGIMRQMRLLADKSQKEITSTLAGVGNDIAGNLPAGAKQRGVRVRGPSEMERIAARGARFRDQAEEAIRTGRSPAFVASLASKANRDLTTAGQKAAAQTSEVKGEDASVLKSELISANETLKAIQQNLAPKSVK